MIIDRQDRVADLSSTDDSALEMSQSEREELWDLLALLQTFCVRKPKQYYVRQANTGTTRQKTNAVLSKYN